MYITCYWLIQCSKEIITGGCFPIHTPIILILMVQSLCTKKFIDVGRFSFCWAATHWKLQEESMDKSSLMKTVFDVSVCTSVFHEKCILVVGLSTSKPWKNIRVSTMVHNVLVVLIGHYECTAFGICKNVCICLYQCLEWIQTQTAKKEPNQNIV